MFRRSLTATILSLLILAATVAALPNGEPNIQGSWEAVVKVKEYSTETAGEKGRFKLKVPVSLIQKGPDLTLSVFPPDDDPFSMTGQIGGGHFWVSGTTDGGLPRMVVGHVSKNGKKIKATLLEAWPDGISEVKLTMKPARK